MKNKLFVITGCSGVGKTTVGYQLLAKIPQLKRLVTCTTRKKRPGEINKKDYYFISEKKFKSMIKNKQLLEWARVYQNYYGSSQEELTRVWQHHQGALLILDIQGAMTIKKKFPESVVIFIKPDKISNLKKRILKRGIIDAATLSNRLNLIKKEMTQAKKCDYQIINAEDKLNTCISQTAKIIKKYLKLTKE